MKFLMIVMCMVWAMQRVQKYVQKEEGFPRE